MAVEKSLEEDDRICYDSICSFEGTNILNIEKRLKDFLLILFYYRGIVQLVEYRSPKPQVVGSSPTAPVRKPEKFIISQAFLHVRKNRMEKRI